MNANKRAVAERIWKNLAYRLSGILNITVDDIPSDLSIGRIICALFALCHPSTIGEYTNTIRVFDALVGDSLWTPPSEWKTEEEKPAVVN